MEVLASIGRHLPVSLKSEEFGSVKCTKWKQLGRSRSKQTKRLQTRESTVEVIRALVAMIFPFDASVPPFIMQCALHWACRAQISPESTKHFMEICLPELAKANLTLCEMSTKRVRRPPALAYTPTNSDRSVSSFFWG